MKFRPLHDRVLIEVLDSEEKTAGGIIIPDTAKEKPQKGKVVAAGEGRVNDDGKTISLSVKNGDEVIYSKFADPSSFGGVETARKIIVDDSIAFL